MKIGIIANLKKESAVKTINQILNYFEIKEIEPLLETETANLLKCRHKGVAGNELVDASQLIIALGGDGTLLRALERSAAAAPSGDGDVGRPGPFRAHRRT